MKSNSMTEGASWKHILRFALPVLAGAVLQQLYNTVDAIIVGNFAGETSLSAIGTTGSFVFFFLAFAMGLSSGNGVVIAQHYGADDRKMVRENASTGMILLVGVGIIVAVINIILSLYIPLFGVFQGANHSGFPTIVASAALGVCVLETYLFRYSDFLGHTVIWWNGVFGFSMGFLISWIYYFSGRWKKNVSLR